MKGIVYSSPRELRYQNVERPHPGPGEVTVRVEARGRTDLFKVQLVS